jgi:hypothetical protein
MAIGSWDPQGSRSSAIDAAALARFAELSELELLDDLSQHLSAELLGALPGLMQQESEHWSESLSEHSDSDLLHLLRFFTVAENLPGCESAEKSPVIPCAKILRQRGQRIDKELLQWIRQVSKNRYLPYGPL